jgi:putative ABC transport system permease protein
MMKHHPIRYWQALLQEAFYALGANRLRSFLTILGVVIGVASVIMMLSIGEGSRRSVAKTIESLGSNQLIVMSGSSSSGGIRGGAGSLPNLSFEDASAIAELSSVSGVAPVANVPVQAVYGAKNKATSVTGTTPPYFRINNMQLVAGNLFTDVEVRTAANVVVLGDTVVRELFGDQSPVGETIRLQRQTFEVIGVLKAKGQGFGGGDQDDVILMPVTTAQRKLAGNAFPDVVGMIMTESRFPEQKGYTETEITRLLMQRHRIGPGMDKDFSVRDVSSLTETLKLTSTILSVLLGMIAFISLFVGGIGIMNIMLVSVTERTREIGVRMAIGASRASILGQFLIEAVLLSLVGALIGVVFGVGAGLLASLSGVISPVFSASTIVMSMSVAVIVGIAFGFWPAMQASKLQPVEALRYQ